MNLKTIIDEKDKKTIEGNNKTSTIFFDRKCNRLRHHYKTPFNFEVPESFPGITLLKFGVKKNKIHLKKNEWFNKKSPNKNKVKEENKKMTYKQQVMNKIKQTVKDNILRNARRVAYPINPIYPS